MKTAPGLQGGVALLALAMTLSACATGGDIERLETRIVSLEQHRDQAKRSMAEDVTRLEKLHGMLTTAEETLRKSGANLGIRVEQLESQIPKQTGTVEAMAFRLKKAEHDMEIIKQELADRLGSTALFLPADLPKDPDGMWAAAQTAGTAKNLRQAQAVYELYEASFPDDVRAAHALWEIAKLHEGAKDTDAAIKWYQTIYDRHKAAAIAPQAVMRIAEIYVERKECQRAKGIYGFVASDFRGTPTGDAARKLSRSVMKTCGK